MLNRVEGKTVLIGHRLWHTVKKDWWICTNSVAMIGKFENLPGADGEGKWAPTPTLLSWIGPQTIKYANLYYNTKVGGEKVLTSSKLYDTKAEADANAIMSRRIDRVAVIVSN